MHGALVRIGKFEDSPHSMGFAESSQLDFRPNLGGYPVHKVGQNSELDEIFPVKQ